MRRRAEAYVAQARTYEDALDRARDFAAEEMFLIGLNLLSGRLDLFAFHLSGNRGNVLGMAERLRLLTRRAARLHALRRHPGLLDRMPGDHHAKGVLDVDHQLQIMSHDASSCSA